MTYRTLAAPDPDEVAAAYRWWRDEREGWPLARALPVWLAFEGNYEWTLDETEGREAFDAWYDALIDHAKANDWR